MRGRSLVVGGLRLASDASRVLADGLHAGTTALVAGARRRLSPAPVSDDVLAERVRGVANQLEPHPRPSNEPGPQS